MPDFHGPGDDRTINLNSVACLEDYYKLFPDADGCLAIGEVSNIYLYSENTPANIKQYIPEVRLIAVLRNPVDRAYSSYLHLVREGYETETFLAALQLEDRRIQDNWRPLWHYMHVGLYGEQLLRYREYFEKSQIRVYLYEDFCNNAVEVIQDIFAFVGVNQEFVPDTSGRYNTYRSYGSRYLDRLLLQPNVLRNTLRTMIPSPIRRRIRAMAGKPTNMPPVLDKQIRRHMLSFYESDILLLQELIGRDLTHWLS